MITLDNIVFLGGGFLLGVFVCGILAKTGSLFFEKKIKTLSDEALFNNSSRFMALADQYFSNYVTAAKNDFHAKGDELLRTIDPVRQTLDRYETRLNAMEKDRQRAFGSITERLFEVARTQNLLHVETGNLVKALRVPHVRGRWGELTLKRVAELSGMSEYCDFSQQVAIGSGRGSVRPDMVVTLPENRKIIIDAKVPLMAYLDALEAGDEHEKQARMKDHGRQVMKHISDLSSKQYFEQISPSPEFTVLFIPGENFFSAALAGCPDLIERGIEKGVILATPTTLIALLKAVSYSWKQKKSWENAQQIQDLGKELFTRICSMAHSFNLLGKDIEKCVTTYNRTIGSIQSRVMSTAKKLENIQLSSQPLEDITPIDELKNNTREFNRQHHGNS